VCSQIEGSDWSFWSGPFSFADRGTFQGV